MNFLHDNDSLVGVSPLPFIHMIMQIFKAKGGVLSRMSRYKTLNNASDALSALGCWAMTYFEISILFATLSGNIFPIKIFIYLRDTEIIYKLPFQY